MSTLKKVAGATSLVMLCTFLSKIFGFLRESFMATGFGTSINADSYFMANAIPMMLFTIIASALGTALVPIFTDALMQQSKSNMYKLANNVLNTVMVMTTLLIGLGVLLAPQLVSLIAIGFEGEKLALTIRLTRVLFFMTVFILASNIFSAMLYALNKFTMPSIAPIFFNIVIIVYIAFFAKSFGIEGLAVATVIAAVMQAIIQYPSLYRNGYRYQPYMNLKDPLLRKMGLLVLPVLLGSTMQQITVLIDRIMASQLIEGSISALNYANRINTLAIGLFGSSLVLVIYPYLSRFATENNMSQIKQTLKMSVNLISLIMMPITVGFVVLRTPIVKLLFERGEFGAEATFMTATALMFYAIGLTPIIIRDVLSRIFYSLKDTKTPMINGLIGVVVNVVLILMLSNSMSYAGLALAASLSYIFTMITLGWHLRKKIGNLGITGMVISFVKALAASIIMGIIVYLLYGYLGSDNQVSFMRQALILFLTIGVGAASYFTICFLLKYEEMNFVIDLVKKKLKPKAE
ncbi:MAG: murJ [Clostridia bacterium]|jgi:putative peptidoglycan lipid II flippase|nr:murJ [Clostridia bacterium]